MALFPTYYLDTVVAIGVGDDSIKRRWIGTGFIFGRFLKEIADKNKKYYRLWLITNKHVLTDLRNVYIKFNSAQDTQSKDYRVQLVARNGRTRWIGHPVESIDVAAIFLNPNFLREEERRFSYFPSDVHIMDREQMRTDGVTEGDRIFVLGFPMGLVAPDRQYVICRGGYLARVRDFIEGRTTRFLIDATVFPGNSGGPVILCPTALAIEGTKQIQKSELIGIVKGYVPYVDEAVSLQTQQTRITFEENSGLAAVESVDSIIETVELAEKRIVGRAAKARSRAKRRQESTSTEQSDAFDGVPALLAT
jgi:hypothetical protein